MKSRNVAEYCKNAVGTMFLLAGAFFVCSTLLSMRSVLADPIAPVVNESAAVASPRTATTPSRRATANTVTRGNGASRAVAPSVSRTVTSRGTNAQRAKPIRTISMRSLVNGRAVTSRPTASRTVTNKAGAATTRNVRSRTAVTPSTATTNNSRVSLQGTAIRGSKATSTSYTYLTNKLYNASTNYSNIIDSTTGLISADAYSNCLSSYYTCMDEICTARNAAQGRCACAARTKAFQSAEQALETANEELIKVSGELALLIATKGKDVSAAFQLTDAEKVMNCVSWQEMAAKYKGSNKDTNGNGIDDATEWCQNHNYYSGNSECSATTMPSYCKESGNNFGFDIANIEGSSSDILASLQAWANAKTDAAKIVSEDNQSLLSAFNGISGIVSGIEIAGVSGSTTEASLDILANTWGYDLFEYAHNNVCARVLDSCFNGIFEGCGTPPTGGRCANGGTSGASCPFNYNSKITVQEDSTNGEFIKLNERSTTSNATASASCFGYTSSTGDPYSTLRGPVADARRSVMQKYLLDANAACDAYGDQLRTTAQNIGYQKIAAQQSLQQKRMEFANEEKETILNDAITASTNFDECISEIYDCYETQKSSNPGWTKARIRTYCAQIANVPHCYETMICNPSNAVFKAVIDKPDSAQCSNTADYTTNTCRNIVTLNDILNGTGKDVPTDWAGCEVGDSKTCDSAVVRQECLIKAIGVTGENKNQHAIQTWFEDVAQEEQEKNDQ